MSGHPALRRLYRLGGAAAQALARLRAPERSTERLQAGLERVGFDERDPLAALLGGAFSGDTLAGTLDRLAMPAVEPGALPGATQRPRAPRSPDGVVPGVARAFEPLANPRLARLLQTHGPAGTRDAAPVAAAADRLEAAERAIGAAQAAASLARRAAQAGASPAWTQPVRAAHTEATNRVWAAGTLRQPARHDAARMATGAAPPDAGLGAAPAQESAGVTQRLERLVERVESARGGAGTGASPGRPALARAATAAGSVGAGENARPRVAEPGAAGGAEPDRGDRFPEAGRAAGARAQGRYDPPAGGRVGGFRGLAALARSRGGEPAAPGERQPAARSEAMPAAAAWPAASRALADRSAPGGFPALPDAAPETPDGEALARELARLLRREAERHGIDLDGVGP
jgi:hypothetical protein